MTGTNLVVGANGLVGSSVMTALGRNGIAAKIHWETRDGASSDLASAFSGLVDRHGSSAQPWTVYWAAGRGVIGTPESELEAELAQFRQALKLLPMSVGGESGTFVLISSAGAVYPGEPGRPYTETSPEHPTSPYGWMKLAQERALTDACAQTGMRGLSLRVASVYGRRQDDRKPQGLISALVRSLSTRTVIPIFVPRETRRHYVWSEDVGRIAVRIAESPFGSKGNGTVRLVYSERSRTISEVVETVARVCRQRPRVQFMPINHREGHGFDLTLSSHFSDDSTQPTMTSLAVGIRRLHSSVSGG